MVYQVIIIPHFHIQIPKTLWSSPIPCLSVEPVFPPRRASAEYEIQEKNQNKDNCSDSDSGIKSSVIWNIWSPFSLQSIIIFRETIFESLYNYRVSFTHTFVVVRALIVILMVIEVGTFYCRVVNEITGLFIPHRKQRKIQMRWDDVNNSLSFSTNTFSS